MYRTGAGLSREARPMVAAYALPERSSAPSLTLDDENDLRWYYNESEGQLGGLRSNFGAQLERAASRLAPGFSYSDPDGDMVDRLDAHRARRLVHRRLLACRHHARILEAVFDEPHPSMIPGVYVRDRFGRLAGVAALLGPPGLESACQRMACGKASPLDGPCLANLTLAADEAYTLASAEYMRAKAHVR